MRHEETAWVVNEMEDEADPQDGLGPICYWWEDMRPREVRWLIMEVYDRGRQRNG